VLARLVPLGLITLVFNLGGGVIAPGLPLYARSSLGADYRDLGLIGASHGLAFAALTIPLGRASDRFGRRAILLLSALTVGAAAGSYLLATEVTGLAAAKFLEAIGCGPFGPLLEASWPSSSAGARTRWGRHGAAYAAAFMLGSSAAGFVIEAGAPRPLCRLPGHGCHRSS
jgi:MFS family permease